MTITDNQLMLAAIAGTAGILAAFMPMLAVVTVYIKKTSSNADTLSIWTFLVTMMLVQLLVSLTFYWGVAIFDAIIKIKDLKLQGSDGVFAMFWQVPIINASPLAQSTTYYIEMLRSWTTMINAFIAPLFIMVGLNLGFATSSGAFQTNRNGSDGAMDDFVGLMAKLFIGGVIAGFVYVGWAKMAMYTMLIPSADGGNATLIDASQQWWRHAFGMTGGKSADTIKF